MPEQKSSHVRKNFYFIRYLETYKSFNFTRPGQQHSSALRLDCLRYHHHFKAKSNQNGWSNLKKIQNKQFEIHVGHTAAAAATAAMAAHIRLVAQIPSQSSAQQQHVVVEVEAVVVLVVVVGIY